MVHLLILQQWLNTCLAICHIYLRTKDYKKREITIYKEQPSKITNFNVAGVFLWRIQFYFRWKKVYSYSKPLRISEGAPTFVRKFANCSCPLIYSLWIPFLTIISHTLATSTLRCQSLTRFDDFKVSTRDAMLVLRRTSGNLGSLNIPCSMAAINIPVLAVLQNAEVSEANGFFITLSSFFDDRHIGAILFILSQTKMIKPPLEDPSSKLAWVVSK